MKTKKTDNTITNNPAIGEEWGTVRKKLFTPEEIAESDFRVKIIGELIEARDKNLLSQEELNKYEDDNDEFDLGKALLMLKSIGKKVAIVPERTRE